MLFDNSEKQDIKLIRLVKENPVLYDVNHAKYMDFNTREVTWQKIGDEMKKPGNDCKVRWINIRDVHRRILKKNVTDPVAVPRQYKYESELTFMKPFYRDVVVLSMEDEEEPQTKNWQDLVTDSPVEEVDLRQASDNDSDAPIIKKPKPRKRKAKKKKEEEPCFEEETHVITLPSFSETLPQSSELESTDSVDAFLLSIGSTLKTFSPYHLNVAKSKIFAIVQDHDLQQIVEREKQGHSSGKVSTSESMYLG
ncbi:hypothetical protein PYW08_010571 [Mythimna loreyi]|uniref:Uncharacterized protein n=1 Tax=Mythimna loreyi TaxID=667449 RepID=A0ACC2Q5T5_9NEOP|nr:hypothetical protein PYW08_010571 [Mythimna loreyi]